MRSDAQDSRETLARKVWFRQVGGPGRVAVDAPPTSCASAGGPPLREPRVPRVARLLALVIRYEQLLQAGYVRDFAELMGLGEVSNARLSQIMNLRHLAPDIQEAILFLPETCAARDPISDRDLRPLAREPNWEVQRKLWKELVEHRL